MNRSLDDEVPYHNLRMATNTKNHEMVQSCFIQMSVSCCAIKSDLRVYGACLVLHSRVNLICQYRDEITAKDK